MTSSRVHAKRSNSISYKATAFHTKFSKVSVKTLINSISLQKLSNIVSLDHENDVSDVQNSMG